MEEVSLYPKRNGNDQNEPVRSPVGYNGIYHDLDLVRLVGRVKTGIPTSKLKLDDHWDQYCQATQGKNDAGKVYERRSSFVPAELSLRALYKQLDQYKREELIHSTVAFDDAIEGMLREEMEPFCRGCRPLTPYEALYGIKDKFGVLEPLNLHSSPGQGFNKLASDKVRLLLEHWDWVVELLVWDWKAIVVDGIIPMWFYKASEKDERRDFARVLDFKTRLFMADCIIPVMTARMLCGDFVRRFMAAGKVLSFFSAAGMEIYYGKWDEFVRYITGDLSVDELYCYDMPKYDKNFPHEWHYQTAQLIASMYEEKWSAPIMRVFARVANAPAVLTITGGIMLRPCDNPSGQFATIVVNTIGIRRLMMRAWMLADGNANVAGGGTSLAVFNRWVRVKIIGDDNIFTLSPGLNPMKPEHFLQAGLEGGWPPDREGTGRLDDSLFAGRGSVLAQIGGWEIFLPFINPDKILAVNEYRKGKPDDVKTLMRAYAAAELAFPLVFHGESELFLQLYDYFMVWKAVGLVSRDPLFRATAVGLPGMERMWTQYTDKPCPIRELTQLVNKQYRCAEEGGASFLLVHGT